jgi:hypothetical protein
MEIDSKQTFIDLTAPELSPEEAKVYEPVALAEYQQCVKEHDVAREAAARCKAVCDANADTLRCLASRQGALSGEWQQFKASLRTELYELANACDVEALASLLRKKTDAMEFVDAAYSFLLEVKAPADEILWLDSLVNQAIAEHGELCAAAVLSRTKTIAALGPVIASEGGQVGVIGGATERLKEEARKANKRIESAQNAAREARLAYERRISANVSRGIITSSNVSHAVPR